MGRIQVKHGLEANIEAYPGLNAELLWAQDTGRLFSTDIDGNKILIGGSGSFVYKGAINCVANPNYPAADCGHVYVVSAPGKIGGTSGLNVDNGDTLFCMANGSPVGDQATVGIYWNIIEYNVDVLPASKGGTGKAIMPVLGDILVADNNSRFINIAMGTDGMILTIVSNAVRWASPVDMYGRWKWQVNSGHSVDITTDFLIQHVDGYGIELVESSLLGGKALTISLAEIGSNTILANATDRNYHPSGFAVNASSVPGRLATGDIVNIPFGTAANQVAWGNHTHSQLHNQSHVLAGSDHTASGLTSGKILQATGTTTFAWSTIILPTTAAQGSILYASATNTYANLAKSTTAGHFLSNSGTNNAPQWRALALSDLPTSLATYYVASYESGGSGITTMTITAATHGCGLIPMVQFVEANGVTDYRVATAEIIINQSTGDVTVNTDIAQKGKVIIVGT
jgi:hypothetical protein